MIVTSLSSFSKSCPVIDRDPLGAEKRTIKIELGYPSKEFFKGDDPRGDERIRKTLQTLGKLRK